MFSFFFFLILAAGLRSKKKVAKANLHPNETANSVNCLTSLSWFLFAEQEVNLNIKASGYFALKLYFSYFQEFGFSFS